MSSAMVRAYCHVVIKLSDTLQTFAEEKERTSNVHGVRLDFLTEGYKRARGYNGTETRGAEDEDFCYRPDVCKEEMLSQEKLTSENRNIYFVEKLLWAKGLDKMLELENYYKACTGNFFAIDIYGNGPEEKDIKRAFHGRGGFSKI
jgi:hypothetical protein